MIKKDMRQKKNEFSKTLLIQESVLIWITTICFIVLAFYCVIKQYFGELPWLTAICGFPWTAYGVSQAFYYKKAEKENILKINNNIQTNDDDNLRKETEFSESAKG